MISIVIPTLNEEKCVADCIKSLLAQDYKGEYEIIIVDGFSKDTTAKIVSDFKGKVKLLTRKPEGPGAARNFGAASSKAGKIAFIDADCIAPSHWVSEIDAKLSGDVIGLGGVLRPEHGTLLDKVMFKANSDWWVRFSSLLGIYQLYGNNCAYRKDKFDELKGFNMNVSFWEDTELSMRAKKIGKLKIDGKLWVETSTRRFRQMGYPRVFWINLKAFVSFTLHRPIKTKYFQEIEH